MNSLIKYLLTLLSSVLCLTTIAQINYVPNTLIVKVKPKYRAECRADGITNTSFVTATNNLQLTSIKQLFGKSKAAQEWDRACVNCVDISLIYELKFNATAPLRKVIAQLEASGVVEYAEVKHIHELQYTPNDPFKTNQYYITDTTRMSMYKAWNINKGDTNVVIGIVDTGSDWGHEDLQANVKNNYNDPINGIDDDLDGYIDNYRGWDVYDNDNDPYGPYGHGTLCAGIAAATTNNNKGISGVGFNCKFLPVKIGNDQGYLGNEYEGIVYAADHGCSVINCSWGGVGATSQYALDVIRYATYNRNALVIGAAGNKGNEQEYYPASYDDVVSVANVDNVDTKFIGSTYNYKVDVSAPGTAIYTTFVGNNYGGNGTNGTASGTSFAAPAVAGVAGLLRAQFPADDAQTIAQRIKASTDNIYGTNFQYFDKLGTGRINAYKALTQNDAWLAFVTNRSTSTNYTTNDTLTIKFTLKNYIAPSTNISVTANSTSAYLQGITTTYTHPTAAVSDTFGNMNTVGIQFKIVGNIPFNTVVSVSLQIFANGKSSGREVMLVTLNPDYLTVTNNAVTTTITSNGSNGFTNNEARNGVGFNYKGNNALYESSFMLSNKWQQTTDGFRAKATNDTDWVRTNGVKIMPSSTNYTTYESQYNNTTQYNVAVREQTLLPKSTVNYIIKRYTITNTNNANLTNIYAGIIADWDIGNALNKGATNTTKQVGYAYNPTTLTAAGIKVLSAISANKFHTYHIDNVTAGAGGVDINGTNGFSDSLKHIALSTNRTTAGNGTAQGNDVLSCTSVGPFTINAGDSITLDFALLISDSEQELLALSDTAQAHYNTLIIANAIQNKALSNTVIIYPNPVHDVLTIANSDASILQPIIITNMYGQVYNCIITAHSIDVSALVAGMYYVHYGTTYLKFIKQ